MKAKGLIAAGGEATRLGELTRVVNKHLLPVGAWPMIFYPLQLLELAGVHEVMIVTGQGHAGQLIDLLGNGQMSNRGASTPLFDLDLTYKVQVEAGGIAQVVGMAESFTGGDDLIVCLGDNIFEYAEADAIRSFVDGDDGAAVFVVEKAGVVDLRYPSPPSNDAVVGLYAYSPDVFDVIRGLEPSSRGELEITDVNRHYAEQGTLACHRVRGWWEDAGTQESLPEIGALIGRTGVNKVAP